MSIFFKKLCKFNLEMQLNGFEKAKREMKIEKYENEM